MVDDGDGGLRSTDEDTMAILGLKGVHLLDNLEVDKERRARKGLGEAYEGDLPWWFRLVNTMYLHLGTWGWSPFCV